MGGKKTPVIKRKNPFMNGLLKVVSEAFETRGGKKDSLTMHFEQKESLNVCVEGGIERKKKQKSK